MFSIFVVGWLQTSNKLSHYKLTSHLLQDIIIKIYLA